MTLEELYAAAQAGDPDAIAMLNYYLSQPPGQGPGIGYATLPQQLAPALEYDKQGNPEYAKQLNYWQDASGESADMMTAGSAGGDAFAPGTFESTETWEPLKTPVRSFLTRLAGPSGVAPTSWEGWVAQALLEDKSFSEAKMVANQAIQDGVVPPPTIDVDQFGQPTTSVDRVINDFAMENFKGLAMEPDVHGPDVRQNSLGQFEARGEDQRTPGMEFYDKLGLPYPNEEYSYDWLLNNDPGAAQRYDESSTQMADAEAMLRNLMPRTDARGNWLEGAEPTSQGSGPPSWLTLGSPQYERPQGSGSAEPDTRDWAHEAPVTKGWWEFQDLTDSITPDGGSLPMDLINPLSDDNLGDKALDAVKFLFEKPGNSGPIEDRINAAFASQGEKKQGKLPEPKKSAVLGMTTTPAMQAEQRRSADRSPERRRQRISAIESRNSANSQQVHDAMTMWVLKNLGGRSPYGDAVQARQNVIQQAGGAPPWGY